jgi:hypothetical protein
MLAALAPHGPPRRRWQTHTALRSCPPLAAAVAALLHTGLLRTAVPLLVLVLLLLLRLLLLVTRMPRRGGMASRSTCPALLRRLTATCPWASVPRRRCIPRALPPLLMRQCSAATMCLWSRGATATLVVRARRSVPSGTATSRRRRSLTRSQWRVESSCRQMRARWHCRQRRSDRRSRHQAVGVGGAGRESSESPTMTW